MKTFNPLKIFEIVLRNGAVEVCFKDSEEDAWKYAIARFGSDEFGIPVVEEINEIVIE